MRHVPLLITAFCGCQAPEPESLTDTSVPVSDSGEADTTPADTAAVEDTDTDPTDTDDSGSGFNGTDPSPAIPLPTFTATNSDGVARGPEHLTGDPSIIWFFRDAGSAG